MKNCEIWRIFGNFDGFLEFVEKVGTRANEIFGVSMADDPMLMDNEGTEDDFDYWPDELVPLGVAADDAEVGSSPGTTTSTTSETETTEGTEATDEEDDEDAWPIEMLVG